LDDGEANKSDAIYKHQVEVREEDQFSAERQEYFNKPRVYQNGLSEQTLATAQSETDNFAH